MVLDYIYDFYLYFDINDNKFMASIKLHLALLIFINSDVIKERIQLF